MSQGMPQEGAPALPIETTEAVVSEYERGLQQEKHIEDAPIATGPVVYLPKEMPTDPEEYKRVLASIYEQAGNIVADRAQARQLQAEHEEFSMVQEAERENREILAQMNTEGERGLGFFSRLGNWIRGDK